MRTENLNNLEIIEQIRDLAGSVTMEHFPEVPPKMADADEWDYRVQSGLAEAVVVSQGRILIGWFGLCLIQMKLGADDGGGVNTRLLEILEVLEGLAFDMWDAAPSNAPTGGDEAPKLAVQSGEIGINYGKAGPIVEKLIALAASIILEGDEKSFDPSDAEEWDYRVQSGLAEAAVEILGRDIHRVCAWFSYCMVWAGLREDDGILVLEPRLLEVMERLEAEAVLILAEGG